MARPTTIEDRQLPVTIMVMDVADMGMEAEEEAANDSMTFRPTLIRPYPFGPLHFLSMHGPNGLGRTAQF